MTYDRSDFLKKLSLVGVIMSLGIIYGDIGTSPLYVMKAVVNNAGTGTGPKTAARGCTS